MFRSLNLSFTVLLYLVCCHEAFTQKYLGGAVGFGIARPFNLSQQLGNEYSFQPGIAFSTSLFYEESDTVLRYRISGQYQYRRSVCESKSSGVMSQYHDSLGFGQHVINLDLDYLIRMSRSPRVNAWLVLGLGVACNARTSARGFKRHTVPVEIIDSAGTHHFTTTLNHQEVDDKTYNGFNRFGLSINIGLEMSFRLNPTTEILIHHKNMLVMGQYVQTVGVGVRRQM